MKELKQTLEFPQMSSQELKHYVLKTKRLARQTRQMKKKTHRKCLSRDETRLADMSYSKTKYKGENK